MRVLLIHQYYEQTRGSSKVFFGVEQTLRSLGHEPIAFTSQTAASLPTPYSHFFPAGFSRQELAGLSLARKAQLGMRGLYSFEARRQLGRLIEETKPELAIVFRPDYQLSQAVLVELKERRVPTIQWVVDFGLWCTQTHAFNPTAEAPCYRCFGGAHWNAIRFGCSPDSRLMAAYGAAARLVSHRVLHVDRLPNLIVVPCVATRQLLVERAGLPVEKMRIVRHPMDLSEFPDAGTPTIGDTVVFSGMLQPSKGASTLLDAIRLVPRLKVEIYGINRLGLADELHAFVARHGLAERVLIDTELRFGPVLIERIRKSLCVVIPSVWADTSEYATLEAMALGKAVIVSDLGGNREYVEQAGCGIVVPAGRADALAAALRELAENPDRAKELGLRGRQFIRDQFSDRSFMTAIAQLIQDAELSQHST